MSLTRLVINTPDSAASVVAHLMPNAGNKVQSKLNLGNFFQGMAMGTYPDATEVEINTGAVAASGTGTFTGAATADQTMTIAGVTFTAKASPDEAADQYLVSATVALAAASLVRAINASTGCAGKVTATSLNGVVTITAAVPGAIGNVVPTVDVNTANFTFAQAVLANGSNGTRVAL